MKKICVFLVLALTSLPLWAKPLPPLGKRKYILESGRPEIPATIEGINGSVTDSASTNRSVMKDPIPLTARVKDVKVWRQPERVISKSSQIKIEKVAVAGRYSVPRVPFAKERKVVGPAEQPVKRDFKKKVQESEDMLRDLNW
jgi:hypothetical protein